MKIALIGASGFVGKAVLSELLNRGHEVTAVVRNPENIKTTSPLLIVKKGNVLNASEVSDLVTGVDAVVSTYNPGWTNPHIYSEFLAGSLAIQVGVRNSGVKRVLFVGGAGSLEVAPGVQLIDTPKFPEEYKPGAGAARDYLNILKKEDELNWTFLSPAIEMHPGTSGTRTGVYSTALDNPVFDARGRSIISVEDLAVAIVDELEHPQFVKQRFTVAY